MRNQRIFFNVTKLKNVSQITNAYKHNTRKACCENADKSKNDNREIIVRNVTYGEFFKGRVSFFDKTIRKDAVKLIEFVLSAPSQEKLAENPFFSIDGFCLLSKKWAICNFGEMNIAGMHLHLDERAPHIHLVVVPMTLDGRLSAKDVIGPAWRLSELQSSYAKAMEPLGLVRGEKLSAANHVTLKEYYSAIAKTRLAELPLPEEGEPARSYYARANSFFKDERSQSLDELNQMRFKYEKEATKRRQLESCVIPEALEKENQNLKQKIKELEELRQKEKAIFEKKLSDAEIMNDAMLNIRRSFQKGLIPKEDLDMLQRLMTNADIVGGEDRKCDGQDHDLAR